MIHDEHDGNTRNLPNPTLQVLIAGGDDVATILPFTATHHAYSSNTLHDTVISIGSLVRAGESLEAGVFGQAESHMVARAQLLQLRHNAIGDIRNALCEQTIHEILHDVQLVLNREVDKVRIDQNSEWRTERGIVLKEQTGRHLLNVTYQRFFLLLLPLFLFFLVFNDTAVLRGQYLGPYRKAASLCLFRHGFLNRLKSKIPAIALEK